jgi:hypothetical protein
VVEHFCCLFFNQPTIAHVFEHKHGTHQEVFDFVRLELVLAGHAIGLGRRLVRARRERIRIERVEVGKDDVVAVVGRGGDQRRGCSLIVDALKIGIVRARQRIVIGHGSNQ